MTEIEIALAFQEALDELTKAINSLALTKKQIIQQLAEKMEKAGYPVDLICGKITEELHNKRKLVNASHIRDCLDDKYKQEDKIRAAPENRAKAPENRIEESPKPVIIDTSGEPVDDETDEQHDTRSENIIQDQVKASMNASTVAAGHDYDQEKGHDYGIKYDYSNAQKEENKIRFELKEDIENLRLELDNARGIIELQRGEIEASKNQKLEARIIDIEELNKTLKIENEQLRHALTKHSFETAKEMQKQADPQELENLTNYIKNLESVNLERYHTIEELNKKIESFSNLDHVLEHQPLELDLTDKGGFLGQFFSYRGRKVKVIHDGIKVTNVSLYRLKEVNK